MNILAADIGGTYSRFAWQHGMPGEEVPREFRYRNADHADFEALLAALFQESGIYPQYLDRLVLALPAPVQGSQVKLTNIDWLVDADSISRHFGIGEVLLLNDFQAAAVGAIEMAEADLRVVNPGQPEENGPMVVTGAGTGLGLSWLPRRRPLPLPQATEGGHADFAPNGKQQLTLYQQLAGQFGHVSYERLLSGDGLAAIHRFLAPDTFISSAEEVTARAAAGDKEARHAIELFTAIFGSYVGNLALLFNPGGGIYLCGGMLARIAPWFDTQRFLDAFADKGRMRKEALRIPVYLAIREDAGLQGAIALAMADI